MPKSSERSLDEKNIAILGTTRALPGHEATVDRSLKMKVQHHKQ